MKKLTLFTVWLVLAIILTFSPPVSADVIFPPPPDSHHLDWCVKVVNLNDFPNLELIARFPYKPQKGPTPTYYETYLIENNKCLITGDFTVGPLTIYWNTRDRPPLADFTNPVATLGLDGGYVSNSDPLIKETFEFSIAGFSGSKLMIYKSRHISAYNDGRPAKVETLPNPWSDLVLTRTPPPQPGPNPAPTLVTPTTPVPPELMSPGGSNAPPAHGWCQRQYRTGQSRVFAVHAI